MNEQEYLKEIGVLPEGAKESVRGYLVGLGLSLAFCLGAYALVERGTLGAALPAVLLVLAFAQFLAQSFYFLHIRREGLGRDRFIAFCSFSAIVLVLAIGSLWIMNHLDSRMMTPAMQMEYMQDN